MNPQRGSTLSYLLIAHNPDGIRVHKIENTNTSPLLSKNLALTKKINILLSRRSAYENFRINEKPPA